MSEVTTVAHSGVEIIGPLDRDEYQLRPTQLAPRFLEEELAPPLAQSNATLPQGRGPLSAFLLERLSSAAYDLSSAPSPDGDPLTGEDAALSLYLCYELHYRGLPSVSDDWEWNPDLLALRSKLESAFLERLIDEIGPQTPVGQPISQALLEFVHSGEVPGKSTGGSVSGYLAEEGTLDQFKEYCIHRSAYQLKEADPHTFAIPRLQGAAKAALVQIQADEYGQGREVAMHQSLFAVTMAELGLDSTYGHYLDVIPGATLAAVNLISLFALHRKFRAAAVGHLALFEMTSVEPMARSVAALRRLGYGPAARQFFEVHVVADMHHEAVAARDLAGGLVRAEPELAEGVMFGARAAMALEAIISERVLAAWKHGRSSLLSSSKL